MTGAKSRRKGATFERLIVDYLAARNWPHADRKGIGLAGSDTVGTPGITHEIKNYARPRLPEWFRQLDAETEADGNDLGVLIWKRTGVTDPARQYVTMTLDTYTRLAARAGHGRPEHEWTP